MAMNKKGIYYTFLVIIFLAIIMTVFGTFNQYALQDRQEVYEIRIKTMDDFINDYRNDIPRAVRIASFRALLALEDYIAQTGQFFQDKEEFEDFFLEAFENGTLQGVPVGIMNASSFTEYLNRVNGEARKIDILVESNVTQVRAGQVSPWHMQINFTIKMNITDLRELAEWQFTDDYSTTVPLYDVKDPLYTIGGLTNTVRVSPTTPLVNDTNDRNDTTNVIVFVNESYYWPNPRAPSILQRFYANYSSSAHGIESIIRLDELSAQGVAVKTYLSAVDYIYFSENDTSTLYCNIQNLSAAGAIYETWLKLDEEHIWDYNMNETLEWNSGPLC